MIHHGTLQAKKEDITFQEETNPLSLPNTPFEISTIGLVDVSKILGDFEPLDFGGFEVSPPPPQQTTIPNSLKKRKRKNLIIDEIIEIPFEEMRNFISDTSSIVVDRPILNILKKNHSEDVFNCIDYEMAQEIVDLVNRKKRKIEEIEIPRNETMMMDHGFQEEIMEGFGNFQEPFTPPTVKKRRELKISPIRNQDLKNVSSHKCSMEKKSWNLLKFLKDEMKELESLKFSNISSMKRREDVQIFYHLCVLSTKGFIEVEQLESFGEIEIKKGNHFDK
jgi:hypothetical protein